MALIKCPECGKEVSDTAKACVYCGYQLTTKDNSFNSFLDNNISKQQNKAKKKS